MEFGRVSEQELEKIDFLLPKDTPLTTRILSQGKGNTRFHIGCAKWSRKDWVGKISSQNKAIGLLGKLC